jgi:hypothetical protein
VASPHNKRCRPSRHKSPVCATGLAGTGGTSSGSVAPWYGESVGHYEGDELVDDTIGLNDKTFVDNYRTPHTNRIHVVERCEYV